MGSMKSSLTSRVLPAVVSLILATLYVMFISMSTSPLYYVRSIDSQIFQYIGFALTQGKVPYTDIFDHKGLLIYWIDALGILISKDWGIMLLQIIHLTLTLLVWFKMWKSVKPIWLQYALLPFMLLCLYPYYGDGNLTEEWSLLMLSLPYMLYMNNVSYGRKHFSSAQLVITGLCMGGIALLRLNNMAPVCGLVLYCGIEALLKKEYRYFIKSFALIFTGFALPVIAAVAFMWVIGGWQGVEDMCFANITFNLEYSNDRMLWNKIDGESLKFIYKTFLPSVFLLFFVKQKYNVVMPTLISFIVVFFTLGTPHWHYQMVIVPLIAVSVSVIMECRKLSIIFLSLMFLCYIKTVYKQFGIFPIPPNYRAGNTYLECFNKVIAPIPESERDMVWNFNGGFLVYDFYKAGYIQENRMLLNMQLDKSPTLYISEKNKFQKVMPHYVIYVEKYYEDWMKGANCFYGYDKDVIFLHNNYERISSAKWTDGTIISCYKLKSRENKE